LAVTITVSNFSVTPTPELAGHVIESQKLPKNAKFLTIGLCPVPSNSTGCLVPSGSTMKDEIRAAIGCPYRSVTRTW